MELENISTKADRRYSKRKTKENKWIKHWFWDVWGLKVSKNISKFQKKLIKEKLKVIYKWK